LEPGKLAAGQFFASTTNLLIELLLDLQFHPAFAFKELEPGKLTAGSYIYDATDISWIASTL
jgi:hypothetical protein